MNERVNIVELAALLAVKTGRSPEEAERFLRQLVSAVLEQLNQTKQVKVRGLGTFRFITVEARESIHVHTGERFVIPAHEKFSYVPDRTLRAEVNRPFSAFETTEIVNPEAFKEMIEEVIPSLDLSGNSEEEDASVEELLPPEEPLAVPTESAEIRQVTDEKVETVAEVSSVSVLETRIEPPQQVGDVAEAESVVASSSETLPEARIEPSQQVGDVAEAESVVASSSDTLPEARIEPSQQVGDVAEAESVVASSSETLPEAKIEPSQRIEEAESKLPPYDPPNRIGPPVTEPPKYTLWRYLFLLLLLVVVGVGSYQLGLRKAFQRVEKAERPSLASLSSESLLGEGALDSLTTSAEEDSLQAVVSDVVQQAPPKEEELLDRVTIRRGDRLTGLALKYYGHKLFWVYIYQHNRAKIHDPNNVPIGTELEIPVPMRYDIDAKSRRSLEKAAVLQTEILTAK